jgi:hypothetical protein
LERGGDAAPNTSIDLSFAAILRDLNIPPLAQHDGFNDTLMTAMMYVALRDIKERGVRIPRSRRHAVFDPIGGRETIAIARCSGKKCARMTPPREISAVGFDPLTQTQSGCRSGLRQIPAPPRALQRDDDAFFVLQLHAADAAHQRSADTDG